MAVHIWRYLLIDRIGIIVVIGADDLHKYAYSQMYSMQAQQSALLPGGRIKVKKDKYWTRWDYYPTYKKTPKRRIAEITVGKTKLFGNETPYRYFVLDLYPSKFYVGEFEHFKQVLCQILPKFAYEKLYQNGHVNYLELASDSLSHQHHSFIPIRKYCTDSMIFKEENGHLGTTYLGSIYSDLRFRIYDKRKQLLDTGQESKYQTHTRIEAALRRVGLEPVNLIHMANPFEKIEIAELQIARQLSKETVWQGLLDQCLKDGSPSALALYPKQRKQFMKMLRTAAASWWNPHDLWLGLPNALKAIAP